MKIEGIVISVVRHNERSNIVTLYTRERGRMVCVTPAPKVRSRLSGIMLLSVVEADIKWCPNRDIQQLHRYTVRHLWPRIYSSPIKATLVLFLSEFLGRVLRESVSDEGMWRFLHASLEILEQADRRTVANFHIVFLVLIADFLGISPDVTGYSEGSWFDMRTVQFSSVKPAHNDAVPPREARVIPILMRLTYANARGLLLSGSERSVLIDAMLHYYGLHLPGTDTLKSPAVLAECFSLSG